MVILPASLYVMETRLTEVCIRSKKPLHAASAPGLVPYNTYSGSRRRYTAPSFSCGRFAILSGIKKGNLVLLFSCCMDLTKRFKCLQAAVSMVVAIKKILVTGPSDENIAVQADCSRTSCVLPDPGPDGLF